MKAISQLVSQVAPPSAEKAWRHSQLTGVMADQRKRTLIGRPSKTSSPRN